MNEADPTHVDSAVRLDGAEDDDVGDSDTSIGGDFDTRPFDGDGGSIDDDGESFKLSIFAGEPQPEQQGDQRLDDGGRAGPRMQELSLCESVKVALLAIFAVELRKERYGSGGG
ncbi:unnamed protein product [Linum trigynum]|uniref:Uncharacterized protein n=1 Tax=Linum trigynum TaxID=586398 RepID=A0AAV2EAD9_9ROSI